MQLVNIAANNYFRNSHLQNKKITCSEIELIKKYISTLHFNPKIAGSFIFKRLPIMILNKWGITIIHNIRVWKKNHVRKKIGPYQIWWIDAIPTSLTKIDGNDNYRNIDAPTNEHLLTIYPHKQNENISTYTKIFPSLIGMLASRSLFLSEL